MSRAALPDASALTSGRGARWPQIVAAAVVATWATIAFAAHDWLYDSFAVISSVLLLGAAAAFFTWDAPPGREAFRLLAFFVMGQAFLSSGLGVIVSEDDRKLRIAPTTEAFSFAVESTLVFAVVFLAAAYITAPKDAQRHSDEELMSAGPTEPTAFALAGVVVAFTALSVNESGRNFLARLGQAALPFVNPNLLMPLLTAAWLLSPRRMRAPLLIVFASQAFLTFLTSMLGAATMTARSAFLANVFLRKRLPLKWIAALTLALVLLTPVKYAYRGIAIESGDPADSGQAWDYWSDAISATYERPAGAPSGPTSVDSTVSRLNYNAMSAHVYGMLQGPLEFEQGATYADIPTFLIPRAIYPDKPVVLDVRGPWFIKLGIQTRETAQYTAFAIPASTEAYWNFGWPGVPGVAFVLGLLVGLMLRLAPRDPAARTAFVVLTAVTLGQFLDMLVWVIPHFLTVAASAAVVRLYVRIGKPTPIRAAVRDS